LQQAPLSAILWVRRERFTLCGAGELTSSHADEAEHPAQFRAEIAAKLGVPSSTAAAAGALSGDSGRRRLSG
jgi:hypothetical protein